MSGRPPTYDESRKYYGVRLPISVWNFCHTVGVDALIRLLKFVKQNKNQFKKVLKVPYD